MPSRTLGPDNPIQCRRLYLDDGDPLKVRAQDPIELCLLTDGSALHRDARVGPGALIIAPPGRGYTLAQPLSAAVYTLSIHAPWLMDDARASWGHDEHLPAYWTAVLLRRGSAEHERRLMLEPETLHAAVRELEDLRAAPADAAPIYRKAALLKLMALLAAAHAHAPQPHDEHSAVTAPVARVLDEIEHSLAAGHPFRVADAAAAAAMTADHLCRLFREATGESPRTYYQRRRIQEAARLLQDPTRPIAAIAKQLGYCDAAHFTNIFKGVQGVTPSAYRKRIGR